MSESKNKRSLSPKNSDATREAERDAVVQTSEHYRFEGPLPPASELERYERALPGLAERVVAMAEYEQKLREKALDASIENDKRTFLLVSKGQRFVFAVIVLALACAAFGIARGEQYAACGAFGVAAVVGYLMLQGSAPNDEKKEKN